MTNFIQSNLLIATHELFAAICIAQRSCSVFLPPQNRIKNAD